MDPSPIIAWPCHLLHHSDQDKVRQSVARYHWQRCCESSKDLVRQARAVEAKLDSNNEVERTRESQGGLKSEPGRARERERARESQKEPE